MYIKGHTMTVLRRQKTTFTLSPTVTGLIFSISDTSPLHPLHSGKLTITSVSLINTSVPSLTGFTSHQPLTGSFTSCHRNDVKHVLSLWSRNGELIFPNMYINFKTFTVYCWICGLFTFCSLLLVKWFCYCCGNDITTTDGRRSLTNIPTMKVYNV